MAAKLELANQEIMKLRLEREHQEQHPRESIPRKSVMEEKEQLKEKLAPKLENLEEPPLPPKIHRSHEKLNPTKRDVWKRYLETLKSHQRKNLPILTL